jgi:hypothetical protein
MKGFELGGQIALSMIKGAVAVEMAKRDNSKE